MKTTLLICITTLISSFNSLATVCSSVMDGAWENPLTWSCGHVPIAGDTIIISASDTVTISTNTDMTGAASVIIVEGYFLFDTPSAKLHMGCGSKIVIRPGGTIASSGVGTPSHQIKICGSEIWSGTSGPLVGPLIILGPIPLAVSFLEFSASYSAGIIQTSWLVASEFNNELFRIEYSADGMNWETVDELSSNGNHTNLMEYNLESNFRIAVGTSYLRLVQQDIDSKTTILSTITMNRAANFDVRVYPNPSRVGQNTLVHVSSEEQNDVVIEVYDLLGQQLGLLNTKANVGLNSYNINGLVSKQGKYFIKVQINGKTYKNQLVIL